MAGYSQTPLARKLGIKPGASLALDLPPPGWAVPELPDGVVVAADGEPADVIVAFFRESAEAPDRLPGLARRIFPAGGPGAHDSDITESGLRDLALPLGVVDNKVAAIDDDWSGLRVVWRVEHRSGPVPI
jgi:hypothetical protein